MKIKKNLKVTIVFLFLSALILPFMNCSKGSDSVVPTLGSTGQLPPPPNNDSPNTDAGERVPEDDPSNNEGAPREELEEVTQSPNENEGGGSGEIKTTFYVDSVLGNDGNDGTSPESAWKTLEKVNGSTFPEGSTLFLKRGSVWFEQLNIPNSKLTIDAYGSGNLPEINGSMPVTTWTGQGSSIFAANVTLEAGEGLGNISENGELLRPLVWNGTASDTLGGAITGTYTYDSSAKKIYIKLSSSPTGKTYRVSRKLYGINVVNKNDIVIKNVLITRFSLNGINFRNCQNCSVNMVTISNGGGGLLTSTNSSLPNQNFYAGNGIQYDFNSANGVIQNVTINGIFDSCISPQTSANNNLVSGIQIKDSSLDKCGLAGVEISVLSNGGTSGSQVTDILVSGLSIIRSGQGWSGRRYGTEGHGIRVKAETGAGTMSKIVIEKTSVHNSAGSSIKLFGEIGAIELKQLSLFDGVMGVDVQDTSSTSLKLNLNTSGIYRNRAYGVYFNAPNAAGFQIIHNTFYQNGSANLTVLASKGVEKIQNNIFASSVKMGHVYIEKTLSNGNINNNCYHPWGHMLGYNGAVFSTLETYQTSTGFESQGVSGNTGLYSPGGGDLTLYSTTVCKGVGALGLGITHDRAGGSYTSPPSAGAYEYQER